MKRIIALIVIISLLAFCPSFAQAVEITDRNAADEIVQSQILEYSKSSDPIVTWTSETKISKTITLYRFDNTISGFIYNLETEGKPSGYIQINVQSDGLVPFCIGFEGDDYLSTLLDNNNLSLDEQLETKIYYVGGFNYYCSNSQGKIIDLLNEQVLLCSIEELSRDYNQYVRNQLYKEETSEETEEKTAREQNRKNNYSANSLQTPITTTAYNYAAGALSYRNTLYYQDYLDSTLCNHCAPTAATNMVLYWSVARGHTSLGSNDTSIFEYMYDEMNTSSTGTAYIDIFDPILDYFFAYGYSSSLAYALWYGVTFNRIKSAIDSNIPVQLEIGDWSATIGHSINVWGYNTGGTYDYYYVTTNLNTGSYNPSYSLLNISNYSDYRQFEYVGYSS